MVCILMSRKSGGRMCDGGGGAAFRQFDFGPTTTPLRSPNPPFNTSTLCLLLTGVTRCCYRWGLLPKGLSPLGPPIVCNLSSLA